MFENIAKWKMNLLTHGYPKQADDHICGVWVVYVAFALAAQTSPLNEEDQYKLRKKLFMIIHAEAGLPRIAIPGKETAICAQKREELIKKGANIDRFRKVTVKQIKPSRLHPAAKKGSPLIDLTSAAEALPSAIEEMEIDMKPITNEDAAMTEVPPVDESKKRKKGSRSNKSNKKKKKKGGKSEDLKAKGAPLPPLPPPSEEVELPTVDDVFTRKIAILRYIPRRTAVKVRDAYNRTLDLFNFADNPTEQVAAFTLISMFPKCILAHPPRAVGNQNKVHFTAMVLDKVRKWIEGKYDVLWTEVCAIKLDPPSNRTQKTSNVRRCKAVARQGNYTTGYILAQ